MKRDEFNKFAQETIDICFSVLGIKGERYTPLHKGADRLHQFYQIARMRDTTTTKAVDIAGLSKHISRMFMLIDRKDFGNIATLEEWDKNLIDVINYVILLRAVVKEENERRG